MLREIEGVVQMKCEGLKTETIVPQGCTLTLQMYPKGEVDAAIAELKREHHRERHEYIDMVAQLKAKLVEQESENRKLKRALWLARAKRAEETQFLWQVYCHCDKLYFCGPSGLATRKNPYRYISRKNAVQWDEFWRKIKNKCLAKAEEYK